MSSTRLTCRGCQHKSRSYVAERQLAEPLLPMVAWYDWQTPPSPHLRCYFQTRRNFVWDPEAAKSLTIKILSLIYVDRHVNPHASRITGKTRSSAFPNPLSPAEDPPCSRILPCDLGCDSVVAECDEFRMPK